MGRSYWFECPKCSYRTKASGKPDRGVDLYVTTILCRDCRQLYDAVTRIRWPEDGPRPLGAAGFGLRSRLLRHDRAPRTPPKFEAALNRLRLPGGGRFRWINFPARCPASPTHRVQSWSYPDKCPRCGVFLEKSALPYRIWE